MKDKRVCILESQSFRKIGAEFNFTVEFNKDDERDYLEIITEIEDALFSVLDKRSHTFVSASSKGLTRRELEG